MATKLTKKQRKIVNDVEKFLAASTGLTLGELRKMTISELRNLWEYEGLPPVDLVWVDDRTQVSMLVMQLGGFSQRDVVG